MYRRRGVEVQGFLSRADFAGYHAAAALTGRNPRHLDSWLMSADLCREVFLRTARPAQLAVVQGDFGTQPKVPGEGASSGNGGNLETLCRWLDLPRVVILDAAQVGTCGLPRHLAAADGVLIDRIRDEEHLVRLRTELDSLWGIPVLGALPDQPALRAAIEALPAGERPSRNLVFEIGNLFARYWNASRFEAVCRRPAPPRPAVQVFHEDGSLLKLTVAVAYDQAFNCYFADALDLLELRGATVVDFSPLRDEGLPPGTDIVYLGSGQPERFADALAENHCMKESIRGHLRRGARLYAEGGAMAYLCQEMETEDGRWQRMLGVLAAAARLNREPLPSRPVEITMHRANWLGHAGTRLRGYRNENWTLEPVGPFAGFALEEGHRHDLVGSFHAVASRVHLDFAAQGDFVRHFFYPQMTRSQILGIGSSVR